MAAFASPNDPAAIKAQLDQLLAQADTNARTGYGHDRGLQDRIDALRNRYNQAQMATNAAAGDPEGDRLAKSRQKALDLTEGRGDAVMNDAMTNAALQRLQGVMNGKDVPYTDQVVNQQLAQRAGATAEGAGSQAELLRRQAAGMGGSMADPSFQAKLREINQNRVAQNLTSQGQLQSQATLQNFGARENATNSLLSGRMGQMGMANSMYTQGANIYANDYSTGQHQSAVQMPQMNYSFGQQPQVQAGGQVGAPPIQYQQERPQQQPAAAPVQPNMYQGTVLHTNNGGYIQPGDGGQQQPGNVNAYANGLLNRLIPKVMAPTQVYSFT